MNRVIVDITITLFFYVKMNIKNLSKLLLFLSLNPFSLAYSKEIPLNDLNKLKPYVTQSNPNEFYYKADEKIDNLEPKDDPVIGKIQFQDLFECKNMVYKRGIFIWLPEGYTKNNGKYSVIYFHDAQNLFLPSKSSSGFDWKVDETISKLTKERLIKNCIVVAIPSSPKRNLEFDINTIDGKAYSNFIINEVIPFIKKHYPVSQNKEDHIITGAGLGGLISLNIALQNSNVIGGAICLSSIINDYTEKTLLEIKNNKKLPLDIKLYIDTGELDNNNKVIENIHPNFYNFIKELINKGFREDKTLIYNYFKKEPNNEEYWAKRLEVPLLFMLKR